MSATSLLVAPIRHQGVGIGTIYLAHDGEDHHYSREDEETLVMFASQAAMVLANARRHRQEQQTRADLETLIDISPVGVVESVVVTLQDIAAVEELERLRVEFLAMVSHELRAPLTLIKGSAATVLESDIDLDPAVVRQFFRIIEEQVDHLKTLVSDLLDVARIETGSLPVNPEPSEPTVLVDRARISFANAGGANPLQIGVEPALPLVMADRRRIVQVLVNLLTNAARNSPDASAIRVSAQRKAVHVAVSVSDDGRGIPAESLPLLFRKFTSVPSEAPPGDAGLGLAICKGIVEAHGGRICAESDGPGLGARFTFTLPTVDIAALQPVEPVPTPALRSADSGEKEPARVLAVDDDPQALHYIRDALVEGATSRSSPATHRRRCA